MWTTCNQTVAGTVGWSVDLDNGTYIEAVIVSLVCSQQGALEAVRCAGSSALHSQCMTGQTVAYRGVESRWPEFLTTL